MLFYSLRLLSRLPFYALGRQRILPGLKANFCCPALQFHRSCWQCKGNKISWADQKYRGLDLHFWAPNFAFLHYHYNYSYYSYKMPKNTEKKSIFIYYYIYNIYIIYIIKILFRWKIAKKTVITVIVMAIYATSILIQLTTIAG